MMFRCILTALLECKVHEKHLCPLMSALFRTLSYNNTVRKLRSRSAVNALSVYVSFFLIQLLQFSPNLNHVVSDGMNPIGLRFNGLYFKATRNWHIRHWFSHCKCNVGFSNAKITFSQGRGGGGERDL